MTPDQLVPSLDVCRRMVAAGWKAETYFAWYEYKSDAYVMSRSLKCGVPTVAPAPTVAELGEALVAVRDKMPTNFRWEQSFMVDRDGKWWPYRGPSKLCAPFCPGHATEAEARALLWLALNEAKP